MVSLWCSVKEVLQNFLPINSNFFWTVYLVLKEAKNVLCLMFALYDSGNNIPDWALDIKLQLNWVTENSWVFFSFSFICIIAVIQWLTPDFDLIAVQQGSLTLQLPCLFSLLRLCSICGKYKPNCDNMLFLFFFVSPPFYISRLQHLVQSFVTASGYTVVVEWLFDFISLYGGLCRPSDEFRVG